MEKPREDLVNRVKEKVITQNIGNHVNKMPSDATLEQWRVFYRGLRPKTLTVYDLCKSIYVGYPYSAHYTNRRLIENFVETSLIPIDFDSGDMDSSLDVLRENPMYQRYGTFIHTTPSHKPDKPKARMVFVLEEPIKDYDNYNIFYRGFRRDYFSKADRSVSDPNRIFYGSKKCEMNLNGMFMPMSIYNNLLESYKKQEEEERLKEEARIASIKLNYKELSGYLRKAVKGERDRVAYTCTGGRHNNLYVGSARLANLINIGLDEHEIYDIMMEAASINGLLREDGKYSVDNTIKSAIRKGRLAQRF